VTYIPQSDRDKTQMLAALGIESVEELFSQIPSVLRTSVLPAIPAPLTESELVRHMQELAGENRSLQDLVCFAGGGIYDRFIPSIVRDVVSRPEFVTPYTPYQAEVSQGTLQAMFEYQTMVCELTAMEVANASLYDGATSLAEAIFVAASVTRKHRALISRALSPSARHVVQTHCAASGIEIGEVPYIEETGQTDLGALDDILDDEVCCVALQQPNYFGIIEDMASAAEATHNVGALLISAVEPISLGILKPPGDYGADIAVGEGQPLGLVPSFGGPVLGLFACNRELMRQMPGRVVGQTVDSEGRVGYCLTLQAREQHIRRDKATSNICTNEALCALAAGVYLAALGPDGLREVAELSIHKAHYLRDRLAEQSENVQQRFGGAFVNEFVLRVSQPVCSLLESLCEQGFLIGPSLGREYPELDDCLLVAVTEQRTKEDIEGLVAALSS